MKNIGYSVEIVVRDTMGNVKFHKEIAKQGVQKDICLAMGEDNTNQVRPQILEWSIDKLLIPSFKLDEEGEETSEPSKIGEDNAGFYIDGVFRYVPQNTYEKWLAKPRGTKAKSETSSVEISIG